MAKKDIVSVITVKTETSEKSIKTLKQQISLLRRELDNAVIGSEEFETASRNLVTAQSELKSALLQSSDNALSLEGSYNSLVAQMAALKKEWRATADVAKRNDLGRQIDSINTQLKELDETLGNNQRKVGSYAEEFKKAMDEQQQSTIVTVSKLDSLQKMATGLANGYAALQGAMNLLNIENEDLNKALVKVQSAMAIAQGIGGMKDLVEGFGQAKVAFAGATNGLKMFIGGLSGVKKAIIGTGIGALVVAIGMLIANWEKISKLFSDTDPIEKTKKAIEGLNATYEVNDSLMKKVNDEAYLKYIENLKAVKGDAEATAQVMRAYNQELKDNERQLLINNKLEAEALQRAATTDFATVKAAGYSESSKRYKEAQENLEKAVIAANKAQMALAVFEGKEIEEQAKATIEANNKKVESDKKAAEDRAAVAKELAEKRKLISKEIFESTLDDEQKELLQLTEKYNSWTVLFKDNKQKLNEIDEWYKIQRLLIAKKYIDAEIDEERRLTDEIKAEQEKRDANSRTNLDGRFDKIDKEAANKLYTVERQKPTKFRDSWDGGATFEMSKINQVKDITKETLKLKLDAIDAELKAENLSFNRKAELAAERITLEENTNRQLSELNEQYKDQEEARSKSIAQNTVSTFTTALSSASQIISALQANIDTTTKEGFEKNKKMQIATATIQMLTGIVNAISTSMALPQPWGAIQAAINAATVATVGGIQIANIKKQQFNGSGGGVATPSVTPSYTMNELPISYTRNVMTNSETETLNQPIKAYVVESDIADVQKKVEDRTKNTEF